MSQQQDMAAPDPKPTQSELKSVQATIEDKLSIYHLHSCHSRQAWVKGMDKPFPCDCGLIEAITTETTRAVQLNTFQLIANIWKRYEVEVTKRDLSSDKMPKGYRKLTDKEILATVLAALQKEQP